MVAKHYSLTKDEEGYLELRESKIMERKETSHICASEVVEKRCPEDTGNKKLLEEGKSLKAVRCIMQVGQKDLRGYC